MNNSEIVSYKSVGIGKTKGIVCFEMYLLVFFSEMTSFSFSVLLELIDWLGDYLNWELIVKLIKTDLKIDLRLEIQLEADVACRKLILFY